MGILTRFKDIMSANINALLDKAEDPEKMIDQYLRDARSDLAKVKTETAAVMAEETRAKRALDANNDGIDRYEALAAKALAAGEEGDALTFLEEQSKLETEGAELLKTYNLASSNAAKMKELYNKLVKDIQTLETRRSTVAAKAAVAKTQERVNAIGANSDKYGTALGKFADMERKVDARLDKAMAEAELDVMPTSKVADLEAKYSTASTSAQEKLAALKAKLESGEA